MRFAEEATELGAAEENHCQPKADKAEVKQENNESSDEAKESKDEIDPSEYEVLPTYEAMVMKEKGTAKGKGD